MRGDANYARVTTFTYRNRLLAVLTRVNSITAVLVTGIGFYFPPTFLIAARFRARARRKSDASAPDDPSYRIKCCELRIIYLFYGARRAFTRRAILSL